LTSPISSSIKYARCECCRGNRDAEPADTIAKKRKRKERAKRKRGEKKERKKKEGKEREKEKREKRREEQEEKKKQSENLLGSERKQLHSFLVAFRGRTKQRRPALVISFIRQRGTSSQQLSNNLGVTCQGCFVQQIAATSLHVDRVGIVSK